MLHTIPQCQVLSSTQIDLSLHMGVILVITYSQLVKVTSCERVYVTSVPLDVQSKLGASFIGTRVAESL